MSQPGANLRKTSAPNMKNNELMAVANGNKVDFIHPNGTHYSRIPVPGTVISTPVISGESVSYIREGANGSRKLRIHKLSGPCLGKRSF